ncbi:AraC family transcriptional regulator [Hyphococcus sp. DH-69]|uniref:AraC family transcriptional regulator n=1 Tax=Hyphococcus formosus TaxID=3143534 RepID=UPI00398AA92B
MLMQAQDHQQWDGTGLPLSSMARMTSQDIDEVHSHMSQMFCPHELHITGGCPPIEFRHNQASLNSVTFNATDYGHPYGNVVVSIPPMDNLYLVQIALSGKAEITQGKSTFALSPGEMCVLDPEERVKQVFCEGYKHFTVKMSKEGLESVLMQELGFRPRDLHFSPAPVRFEGHAVAFAQMVRTVCDDLNNGSSAFGHSRASKSVEQILQRLLLAAVPHNHSDLFDAPASVAAPYYVRRVEEFITHRLGDPITMDELVSVSGVSARSLHAGFRRFRDTTPMNYLKNRRLLLAHRRLLNGADSGATVTDVALACGFTHLSKFARDYHERFGERPSETLKKIGQV